MRSNIFSQALMVFVALFLSGCGRAESPREMQAVAQQGDSPEMPQFEYDPTWPKQLPNNWMMGEVGAMAMDVKTNHIWVNQRPKGGGPLGLGEHYGLQGIAECCFPAPPILEFDTEGNLVQAWGPIHAHSGNNPELPRDKTKEPYLVGKQVWDGWEKFPDLENLWADHEHGLWVDYKDNVWLGDQRSPSFILKFTRDGKKLLMHLGKEESKSSNNTVVNFGGPTGIYVDPDTDEVFIADGYRNRRVIVLDAETGAYKRHWGAYGTRPPDVPLGGTPVEGPYDPNVVSKNFAIAHCLVMSRDRLLYVCDRTNNRVQVFKPDGTYVNEVLVARNTGGIGGPNALGFSSDPEQRFMYLADGANKKIWIIQRDNLKILGSFGRPGRHGGQVLLVHALAVDAQGNVYVGETQNANRVQKFRFMGVRRSTNTE